MYEKVIELNNISKSYDIREMNRHTFRELFQPKKEKANILWALRDISLDVKKGEAVGIIGANGSGKTTILRLLGGVTAKTSGDLKVNGSVAPLIQVGAGFHPELTGRENIYLNGIILGFSKREIEQKFDEIVRFAELERFIDTPVKKYSSGMYVRLGFSVAIHVDADILLIDEILSVGDVSFQRKCLNEMSKIRKSDKSIVFVSHNLSAVKGLCDRLIWLDKGEIKKEGNPEDVINAYVSYMTSKSQFVNDTSFIGGKTRWGTGEISIEKVELLNSRGEISNSFRNDEYITVKLEYSAQKKIESPVFWVWIVNSEEIKVASFCYDKFSREKFYIIGRGQLECNFKMNNIVEGEYYLMGGIYDDIGGLAYDRIGRCANFSIKNANNRLDKNIYRGYILNFPCSWKHVS